MNMHNIVKYVKILYACTLHNYSKCFFATAVTRRRKVGDLIAMSGT